MSRHPIVYIIVEGRTEQTFIENILKKKLSYNGIMLYSCRIGTPGHKGGNINIERFLSDFENFLKQREDIYISTMFDYYGIDINWPGYVSSKKRKKKLTAYEKFKIIADETKKYLLNEFPDYKLQIQERFIPYFSMHEFETLLFSDPEVLANKINTNVSNIKTIINNFNTIEDINNDPSKAPSKRIKYWSSNYKKVINGIDIADTIGLNIIRKKSKLFDKWVSRLENLIPL